MGRTQKLSSLPHFLRIVYIFLKLVHENEEMCKIWSVNVLVSNKK